MAKGKLIVMARRDEQAEMRTDVLRRLRENINLMEELYAEKELEWKQDAVRERAAESRICQ